MRYISYSDLFLAQTSSFHHFGHDLLLDTTIGISPMEHDTPFINTENCLIVLGVLTRDIINLLIGDIPHCHSDKSSRLLVYCWKLIHFSFGSGFLRIEITALHPLQCVQRNLKCQGYKGHWDQSHRLIDFAWRRCFISQVQNLVEQQLSGLLALVVKFHHK